MTPHGVGLLTFAEQPEALLTELRPFLRKSVFGGLDRLGSFFVGRVAWQFGLLSG